ncbi:alpha/beta hydrolase [Sphingomonas paeninsulae]|uniref:Alpha/beta hydrolase n=1 Tax=Sphingomonas paeninsulae TaxID=2319844 RepID=A0A494TQ87_SPHPE|nr:alpha/beta hydrolase [Sphingomonas paeninsulae]AYJ87265.1 alpha/beta hydrolase [Sphingomonas paeninsulae]
MTFIDSFWWSNDGLRLHYRDYAGATDKPVIVCLPGLTRNARDFDALATRLAGRWRVLAVEFRGRGESAYAKDAMTYVPLTYVQDVEALLTELAVQRVILLGTSLGGIVSMILASMDRERIAGVILNDIGPDIEPRGLERIRGYVGRTGPWPTWLHAARWLSENNASTYPNYDLSDWLVMAKRAFRLTSTGRIVADYDKKISEPFRLAGGEAGQDLWPVLTGMGSVPTLVLHGELSDVLSEATAQAMVAKLPNARYTNVSGVGHAPALDEPAALAAIDAFLPDLA